LHTYAVTQKKAYPIVEIYNVPTTPIIAAP